MSKNIELMDNTNDVLYPRTISDLVNITNVNKNLTQKLNEIDDEFKKYLPLTGGTLTGNLTITHGSGYKLNATDGTPLDAIVLNDTNRFLFGSHGYGMNVRPDDVYFHGKPTFSKGIVIDNNNSILFKEPNGNEVEFIRYSQELVVGNPTKETHIHGTTTIVNQNIVPNRWGEHYVGDVGMPFYGMNVAGGGYGQQSDQNVKEDIRQVQDEEFFNMIKDVEVKSYLYKEPSSEASTLELIEEEDKEPRTQDNVEDNDLNVGIIAQDMAKHDVSKYVLNHSEEGGYSINLYNYSASLHSALRHEIKKREELEERVAKLEKLLLEK